MSCYTAALNETPPNVSFSSISPQSQIIYYIYFYLDASHSKMSPEVASCSSQR